MLADYAADIFKDILEISSDIHSRIKVATARADSLTDKLPEALSFVDGSKVFLGRLDSRPTEEIREQFPQTNLLAHSSMPRILHARYESDVMNRIPDLKLLDNLITSPEELQNLGGTLANRYSNSNFVRDEWIKKKEEENAELSRVKEARKQEKRAKKAKKMELVESVQADISKKKAFNWRDR